MWETVKKFGKAVLRRLGLIKHLNELKDHKNILVKDEEYSLIKENKELYKGLYKNWHLLRYKGTNGRLIERDRMTMGLPKVISERLASLLFNEGVNVDIAKDSEKTAEWEIVKDVITSNKFKREFQRYLEYMFAMGGVVVEVYRDGDEIKLAYATADAVFPTSSDSENIDEIVIANQFTQDGKVYTLLKWHEWQEDTYVVKNELYESDSDDELGDQVNLSKMFPDMEKEMYFENLRRPLFVYMKPNIANNKFITSPLGLSVFENAKDTIKMLDTMYDFWHTEFKLGKRRVAVPEYLVQTGVNIHGEPFNYFDDSEELFVALNGGEMDDFQVKDLTVDLRVEQITESIQSLLDILSLQVGLSAGTFNFKGGMLKTATQVASENSETMRTRSSHLTVVEDALRDLIVTIYDTATLEEIGDSVLRRKEASEPLEREDISIDFNDGIFQDKDAQLKFYTLAYKSGFVSAKRAMTTLFGLSEEEADEWLEEIQAEKARASNLIDEAVADVMLNGRLEE